MADTEPMAKITLRTIAEETGLSKFAVSRALSGKSGVSEATRTMVIQTAERLGYRRAQAPTKWIIGAIFDDTERINGELHAQIQGGMQREAALLGYAVRAHWMEQGGELGTVIDECAALFTVHLRNTAAMAEILAAGKPVVRNGQADPLTQEDMVYSTDREAGAAVARHLLDLGHRTLVYVQGAVDLPGRRMRLNGMHEEVARCSAAALHVARWVSGSNFANALDALLESGARPTAFFCGNDALALAVVTELLARGYRIPDDASVVGFGDFSGARLIRPPLTTVRVPAREIGRAAVRLLHARLRIPDWPECPMRIQITHSLTERSSTGPVPAP